jgi:E2F-associated phosphoprotein
MEDQALDRIVQMPEHGTMMAIVSGDSDCGEATEDEEIFPRHSSGSADEHGVDERASGDDASLYDENLDEEDENYVYLNLRGGKHSRDSSKSSGDDSSPAKNNPSRVTKPRNSDAVLSCPCCFNIVCMDCQKHYKYNNQHRAMFVMGIAVDWQHLLVYDDKIQGLTRWYPNEQPTASAAASHQSTIVAPDHHHPSEASDPIYYAVSCANCHTQVAALDMRDEVYHFFDCIASS